ncbi:hypothetical protein ACFFU9_11130 [Mariniflexile ostreae]|uniref:HTH araC/xylS-type domain-containing protein n=1 Tax=Mariniflexile ostreae TaxID=1520892 RepID=A0ABV5FCW5_9FLAO
MNYFFNLLLVVLFLHVKMVFSQNRDEGNAKFDSVFYDTAVRKSATNIVMASQIADSLYNVSSTDLQKIKSLMLSADLLEKQSKREEAITYTLRAEIIANEISDYEWLSRIYGFLSTQYRIIGLIDQGKRYLEKGLKICDKMTHQSRVDQYRGMVYQEMAHYAIYEKQYKRAVQLLEKANLLFSNMSSVQMKNFFFGNNEEMIGRSYLGMDEFNIAIQHYHKSLKYLNEANAGESQWAGMVFHGLGKIALKQKEYEKSLSYLSKADTIAQAIDHTALKVLIYSDLSEYYQINGDLEKYFYYNKEHLKNVNKNMTSAKTATNKALNMVYENQNAKLTIVYKIALVWSILFFISLGLYYFTRKKRRKEEKYFKAIISNLNSLKEEPKLIPSVLTNKEERFMPEKTEIELLRKLEEFEKKEEFTNPNLRLSVMAADFRTNTKYLSYIINTHKNKDFNNYVNDLRVYYIINKVQDNPNYLNYKISYLSKECGFSSHSKFATIFKNTTGLTPSAFLGQVKASHVEETTLS